MVMSIMKVTAAQMEFVFEMATLMITVMEIVIVTVIVMMTTMKIMVMVTTDTGIDSDSANEVTVK